MLADSVLPPPAAGAEVTFPAASRLVWGGQSLAVRQQLRREAQHLRHVRLAQIASSNVLPRFGEQIVFENRMCTLVAVGDRDYHGLARVRMPEEDAVDSRSGRWVRISELSGFPVVSDCAKGGCIGDWRCGTCLQFERTRETP